MIFEFKLPELGENIKSGVATKILVKAGDSVQKDQTVLELETEKAVLEIPSPVSGIIKEVLVKAGSEVKVGQLILKIESETTKKEEALKYPAPKEESISKTISSAEEAMVVATKETIKAEPSLSPSRIEQTIEVRTDVPAAPSVRRFAREIGIDINQVPGSGPKGRISIDDVKAYAKALNTGVLRPPQTGGMAPVVLPDFSRWGEIERQPLSPLRRKACEHLTQAWQTIPHVTQVDKADITELEKLRKKFASQVEEAGGKLTITSFILKILGPALKKFPQFNASLDSAKNEIVFKKYIHIGIAVDTDRGLIVPVIRDADKKNIIELSVELTQIAEKARNKKTTLEEMQGGTFTVTNLGGIGGTSFTPIVNFPEVAILGISRASMEYQYINEQFVPRLMLPLSLSYDHRVIDGADGARFLRRVCEALQQSFLTELESHLK